ncbi:MAG TPA: class I SAM-dependent methyltransferase [Phycisphaerae bacterium]|nr:class I SAM-dependent methyltransferase [Phycisphaerae bacterium]
MATVASSCAGFDYSATVFGDEDFVDVQARTWGAVRMRRCLESLAGVKGRVLEVGCGAGRCIRTIRRHRPDLEAFGCDLSARSIDAARRHNDGVEYETADAVALPYEDAAFDAVVVMDLLEHVADVGRVLAQIRRVCKPGATLHLHVPCEGSALTLYRPLLAMGIDLTRDAVGHIHHFTRRQVLDWLAQAGFVVTRRRYSMYGFAQLHDIIGWRAMLSRRRDLDRPHPDAAPHTASSNAAAQPVPQSRFHAKHLLTRPAWWLIRTLLPRLQYYELALLSWQPLGSVGLCVTARRCRSRSGPLRRGHIPSGGTVAVSRS